MKIAANGCYTRASTVANRQLGAERNPGRLPISILGARPTVHHAAVDAQDQRQRVLRDRDGIRPAIVGDRHTLQQPVCTVRYGCRDYAPIY
eukprot:COSAG05_NODE_3131_length_2300_cov_2.511131_3_plen_91_part_00